MAHSMSVDPFSKLCQLHTAGTGHIKVIGDENSMEYLLGIRAVARDVFHEEIGVISKAIYEEVSFRTSAGLKEKVVTISNPPTSYSPEIEQIEKAIESSLSLQKVNFNDLIITSR